MICQICSKNPASIHVTEIHYAQPQPPSLEASPKLGTAAASESAPESPETGAKQTLGEQTIEQKHLCEPCAQAMQLPHAPVVAGAGKNALNIWKLLQNSARRARQEGSLACPDCGMTLADFRAKGRLGCPRDYEIFKDHLQPLLRRVHNADSHTGRLPGVDEGERERRQVLNELRVELEKAIADEAYEDAAQLRDQIQGMGISEDSSR